MHHRFLVAALLVGAPAFARSQTTTPAPAPAPLPQSPAHAWRPGWLDAGGELRARAESYDGGGFSGANSDRYVLTRALLFARVRATSSLSFFVQGIEADAPWKKAAPTGAPFRDRADIRQAYVQLGADGAPAALRAGRVDLEFGDGRLVGALPWANTERSFDGALGTIAGSGYRVDAFATRVVRVDQTRFDRSVPGNNFYGVYGHVTSLVPSGIVEPFFFWRRQSGLIAESGSIGTMNVGTSGLRTIGRLPGHFDYDVQMALQRGSIADEQVAAWAGHWLLGRTFGGIALTPRLFAEYNEASGDANPGDNRKGTFDQLYPTGHDKYGLTDLVGWQNMKHVRGGVDVAVAKGWSATVHWSEYWLADPHDALYSGGGAVLARRPAGDAGTYVGDEADVVTTGRVSSDVRLSAGLGHFMPGTFLRNTTPGHAYTYPYAMLTYLF